MWVLILKGLKHLNTVLVTQIILIRGSANQHPHAQLVLVNCLLVKRLPVVTWIPLTLNKDPAKQTTLRQVSVIQTTFGQDASSVLGKETVWQRRGRILRQEAGQCKILRPWTFMQWIILRQDAGQCKLHRQGCKEQPCSGKYWGRKQGIANTDARSSQSVENTKAGSRPVSSIWVRYNQVVENTEAGSKAV